MEVLQSGPSDTDPLALVSDSHVFIKEEFDNEEDYNTMNFLELAACKVQTNQELIEFDDTDAVEDHRTGQMVCLRCLEVMEKNLLYDHMVNAHGYRKLLFKCHNCNTTFQERNELTIHKTECKIQPKKKIRKSMNQLIKEVDDLISDTYYQTGTCPVCTIELPKTSLKEHLLSQHSKPEMQTTCDMCQRTFKSKLTLREHIKLVHEAKEDSEKCELCGQLFRSQKYLSNHKRNVHPSGDKIHQCPVCDKIFKSRLCLQQHVKYVHPPVTASVTCTLCPKVFKSKLNLQQHTKTAHGIKK